MSNDNFEHQPQKVTSPERTFWLTPKGIVALLFVVIVMVLLFTEHRAHVLGLLPWVLILACPLMHLFMHHEGHHRHGHNEHKHGYNQMKNREEG